MTARTRAEGIRSRETAADLDFDRQIYQEDVEVAFLAYLRPEQKFAGVAELQAQIQRDAEKARELYELRQTA